MSHKVRLSLVILLSITVFVLTPVGAPPTAEAAYGQRLAVRSSVSDGPPVPLPEECGGVNPAGEPDPACCLFGYLYDYDGQVLNGEQVTIQSPHGMLTVTTAPGWHSDTPYFFASLSDAPLSVAVGDTITLTASSDGRTRTLTYQVVEQGQQVDLVLPTDTSDWPIVYVGGGGSPSEREVWRLNEDGSRQYLDDGWDPAICPWDGRILYASGGDIHVMDLDGRHLANLTTESSGPGSHYAYNPDWSPDCSQIVYMASYSGRYTIIKMNADGSDKQILLTPPDDKDDWYPKWSSDGRYIEFTTNRNSVNGSVFLMNADGSDPHFIIYGWYGSWSPTTNKIAFIGFEGGQHPTVMNPDGSDRYRLDEGSPNGWWPYWFSDQRLMYVSGGDLVACTDLHIYTVRVDGTDRHTLTEQRGCYRSPVVRPTYVPVATIHSVSPSVVMRGRDTVVLRGDGQDADENGGRIVAYRWWSSLDGDLGYSPTLTLSASTLSTGTHTISFTVQDDEGDWSPASTRTLVVTDEPFDLDVLIITNRERLAALYGEAQATQVLSKAQELAQATNGVVLQVEDDPRTASAYATWMANPASFSAANGVADAIHDQIVARLSLSPDLGYLVIIGDDRVIPFRRVRDRTHHPEHLYQEVPVTTTIGAALAADRFLSDDFYGDRVPTRPPGWGQRVLYLPDMGVGRLIETPEEIIGQIDAFLADGEIEADEVAVTGYDILVDVAQEICTALLADGLYPDCGLIGNTWDATQFINTVLNQTHSLVSYNGHANHSQIGTPQGVVESDEILGGTGVYSGTLAWTPGCHGGLNVPPETPSALDAAQAWARRGALLVGNTGFGWGYQFDVGLSEQLMLDFTRHLLADGETTVGRALRDAKQQYYLEGSDFDEYDEKALTEAVLYGIPMTRVTSPDVGRVTGSASAPSWDARDVTGTLTVEHRHYDFPSLTAETTEEGTYYTCGGQAEHSDGAPIQPRYTDSLVPPYGRQAHGVVLRAARGNEIQGVDPVVEQAVALDGEPEPEADSVSTGWFPEVPVALRQTDEQEGLVFGVGQFYSGAQRLYGAADVAVFYSTADDDWEPPMVNLVASGVQSGAVTVTVAAVDASGIYSVVVAYGDGGDWASAGLSPTGDVWQGGFPGSAETEFFVQVVDGAGNVAAVTRGGRYMRGGEVYRPRTVYLPLVLR